MTSFARYKHAIKECRDANHRAFSPLWHDVLIKACESNNFEFPWKKVCNFAYSLLILHDSMHFLQAKSARKQMSNELT